MYGNRVAKSLAFVISIVTFLCAVASVGMPFFGDYAMAAKVTIRFGTPPLSDEFRKARDEFNTEFMRRHPNILAKVEEGPDYSADRRIVQAAAGALPDIFWVTYYDVHTLIRGGVLKNLLPLVKSDKEFAFEDIFPGALTPFWGTDGNLYAIAYDAGPILPIYNVDLLDNLGLPAPTADWTFDRQFLEILKKATKDTNGDGRIDQWGIQRFYDVELWTAPMLRPWGGRIVDDKFKEVLIDSPEAIAGIRWWTDLHLKYHVTSYGQPVQFNSGKIAMNFGGSWMLSMWRTELTGFRYAVAPMPKGPAGRFACILGSGYAINAQSKHPDEAWTYLREFLGKEGMERIWGRTGLGSPARRSAWPSFIKVWGGDKATEFAKALEYGVYGEIRGPAGDLAGIINRELNEILSGRKGPEEAARAIKREGDLILAKYK